MELNYKPLWKLLIDKNMSKKQLREAANISTTTISRMTKNMSVNLEVILRICKALECEISDIVVIVSPEHETM